MALARFESLGSWSFWGEEMHPSSCMALNGWKAIAQYVGRGVRTVRRWEAKYGLPIHRPVPQDRTPRFAPKDRTPVCASEEELDHWLLSVPTHQLYAEDPDMLEAKLKRLKEEVAKVEQLLASKAQPTQTANPRGALLLLTALAETFPFSSTIPEMSLLMSYSV
jgi:hypothetical protein